MPPRTDDTVHMLGTASAVSMVYPEWYSLVYTLGGIPPYTLGGVSLHIPGWCIPPYTRVVYLSPVYLPGWCTSHRCTSLGGVSLRTYPGGVSLRTYPGGVPPSVYNPGGVPPSVYNPGGRYVPGCYTRVVGMYPTVIPG